MTSLTDTTQQEFEVLLNNTSVLRKGLSEEGDVVLRYFISFYINIEIIR